MTITINTQPVAASVSVDQTARFTVDVTSDLPVTYQWYQNNVAMSTTTATSDRLLLVALLSMDANEYYCQITDGVDTMTTNTVTLSVSPAEFFRSGLVWNYEDNNFGWFDVAVDKDTSLEAVVCMKYQPDPGWQTRWSDLQAAGTTWADLQLAGTKWSDFYSGPAEDNLYWLTDNGVYVADQAVKSDGIKAYICERTLIDLNDIVPAFTVDRWIYAKQLYFLLKGLPADSLPNPVHVAVGWSDTLMDDPDYLISAIINLQSKVNGGSMKYDFRSTGRFLALKMWFNQASKIQMTGAELDAEQRHGR